MRHGWVLLLLLPGLLAMLARPIAPLDETRLLGVAWEMWTRGDFLVPYMNGEPYSHKPPLMLWLIQAGWAVFGVSDWWPRLLSPLLMIGSTLVSGRLAAELWPDNRDAPDHARWLLAGTLGWLVISQMILYDPLLTLCTMMALLGAWRAGHRGDWRDWSLLSVGIGLGLLAKGPVVLVHVLIACLLAPTWSERARSERLRWYGGLLLSLTGGVLIALSWAIPAARSGGEIYANAILFGQTAGRMVASVAHARPWWAYVMFLPPLLLPWIAMPLAWSSVRRSRFGHGHIFLLCWLVGTLLVMSLISAKQPHYIVPEVAAAMLLLAGSLPSTWPPRRAARLAWVFALPLLAIGVIGMRFVTPELDMRAPAQLARQLQEQGIPLAAMQRYYAQLAFPGRLPKPVPELAEGAQTEWFQRHGNGVVLTFGRTLPGVEDAESFASFPYRHRRVEFWRLRPVQQEAGQPE